MTRYCVTFRQENRPERSLPVSGGISVSQAAEEAGIELRTHCGGTGRCGKCCVVVNSRKVLACQTRIESDLEIFLPESSLRNNEHNIVVPHTDIPVSNQKNLSAREGFGAALDLGTTTLAAELHDFSGDPKALVSRINPLREFGDDVITRIRKVQENPALLYKMQHCLVSAVNEMLSELAVRSAIIPQDITILTAAGNTVMQSLFFGIDPTPLGQSPFQMPIKTFPERLASGLGLNMSADALLQMFPIFGGFVGGDIVAGVLALPKLFQSAAPHFLLDIGTNGEIVLAKNGELFTAATAAGPAFEGAGIEYGTLAVPGAIDHVMVSADGQSVKVAVSTIGNQPAVGICGSGLIDAVAVLLQLGIVLPGGRFADKRSAFELVSASDSGTGKPILLTQKDIRELQLAAGAIRAGTALLLQEYSVPLEMIETFYVSGGFGQSIKLSSARQIGLLPPLLPDRFQFCGNTSLAGARTLLLHPENTKIINRLLERSHHCELATLPKFPEVFAESMYFA